MKIQILFSIYLLLCFTSCEKVESNYPKGVKIRDLQTINDCTLSACSDNRITRLVANDVIGKVKKSPLHDETYLLSYGASFDSYYRFFFCNLPDEFKVNGLEIIYSGTLIDACDIYGEAVWPIEEHYILKINSIKRLNN